MNSLYHTGRVIIAENFFSSMSLAQEMWFRDLRLVETLRANKTEIPIEFSPCKDRPVYSSIFGFNDYLTLSQRIKSWGHSSWFLSCFGLVDIVDDGKSFKRLKQEIVIFYNRTKGGFDCQDHLISTQTWSRKTEKCIRQH